MPVRRQGEVYPELGSGISLYLVKVFSHLECIKVSSAAYDSYPSASDGYVSAEILCFVVVVDVIFGGARGLLHTFEPHPHQSILADCPRLCFTDNLYSVGAVLEK